MAVIQTAQCDSVIFGAKGDLARRKLLPSCINWKKGQIHPDTRIRVSGVPTGIKKLIHR